ncbi:unnamed protein product [Pseudo-nitzschia multistriata]|uniref:EF-hand domain-containing protein n=1 Tax=Pseudo-nitzschia multistriata TaxID=183589 RepID=A0A448YV17_9STRA|nr:unnamed protein product [Pseudo-nitzschia multistriata]
MVKFTINDDNDSNRHDIIESFEALDTSKTGRIGVDLAYTLLLGLGYMSDYKRKDDFTLTTLEKSARRIERADCEDYDEADFESGIKLETLLTIVATHPSLSEKNHSNTFAQRTFKLIDGNGKGYLDSSDLIRLGDRVGNLTSGKHQIRQYNDIAISETQACDMIETTNQMFAEKGTESKKENDNRKRLYSTTFEKLFASPTT